MIGPLFSPLLIRSVPVVERVVVYGVMGRRHYTTAYIPMLYIPPSCPVPSSTFCSSERRPFTYVIHVNRVSVLMSSKTFGFGLKTLVDRS